MHAVFPIFLNVQRLLRREQFVFLCGFSYFLLYIIVDLQQGLIGTTAFIPFFRLGDCECDGSGGVGSSSGDEPETFDPDECDTTAPCSNPEGATSGGTTDAGSTPFLCILNNEKYVYENDFLFGRGSTFAYTAEDGKNRYESKQTGGDLYKISNTFLKKDTNLFKFQIKEIEPEESFIDTLELLKVSFPKQGELVVDHDREELLIFDKDELRNQKKVKNVAIKDHSGSDVTETLSHKSDQTQILETGSYINIDVETTSEKEDLYLLLTARYRDWAAGTIPEIEKRRGYMSTLQHSFTTAMSRGRVFDAAKYAGVFVIVGILMLYGAVNSLAKNSGNSDSVKAKKMGLDINLASTFGIEKVFADTPHSLVVEGRKSDRYERISIVSPRQHKSDTVAVKIDKSFYKRKKASLRVLATKRHEVVSVGFVLTNKLIPHTKERITLNKAYHHRYKKDFTSTLTRKYSGDYLHTIPGDKVDLEFVHDGNENAIVSKQNKTEFVFHARGFYTPMSRNAQNKSRGWVSRLDKESREKLESMYSLNEYHHPIRETVL